MDLFSLLRPAPIPQVIESFHKTHQLCIPSYGYRRLISACLFSFASDLYDVFLKHADTIYSSLCAHCHSQHSVDIFCFDDTVHPFQLNFLIDLINCTPPAVITSSQIFPLLRLCSYLLLKPQYIFTLLRLYILPNSYSLPPPMMFDLFCILNESGYTEIANYFFHLHTLCNLDESLWLY